MSEKKKKYVGAKALEHIPREEIESYAEAGMDMFLRGETMPIDDLITLSLIRVLRESGRYAFNPGRQRSANSVGATTSTRKWV